jgi:16S rRNA (adenine1518-N6/adenine1519-N6)-dimethyltransferase
VRGAFAHRRKTLAASLELAGVATRDEARSALAAVGLPVDARAEAVSPSEFELLAEELG